MRARTRYIDGTINKGDRIRFNGHVDVGVRMAEVILHRLRFSNEDAEQVVPGASFQILAADIVTPFVVEAIGPKDASVTSPPKISFQWRQAFKEEVHND